MFRHYQGQQGNASLGFIALCGAALVVSLTQTQNLIHNRLKAAKHSKLNLEGQETSLYALSMTRQLVDSSPASLPTIGFKNPVNPQSFSDLAFKSIGASGTLNGISIGPAGELSISAPDLANISSHQIDEVFKNKNFNVSQQSLYNLRAIAWEPYSTGYGVQNIFLEARNDEAKNPNHLVVSSRAKIAVPVPQASCTITASLDGKNLSHGSTVPPYKSVVLNLSCTGVVLSAVLLDGGTKKLAMAGPVTAANNYTKAVARMFSPTLISDAGNHVISVDARLVDGTQFPVDDFFFTILADTGPQSCRSKCDYDFYVHLPGQSSFVDPYTWHKGPFEVLPSIDNNPIKSKTAFKTLTDYATRNDLYPPYIRWQGAAFPNYPNVLVCGDFDHDYDLYAFDPKKNCQKTWISKRTDLGCVREGTLISVAPGVQVPIENLRPGDRIWNSLGGYYRSIRRVIAGPEKKPLIVLSLYGGSLAVTETHPIKTNIGFIQAQHLKVGELVFWKAQWHALQDIRLEQREGGETVWNLELDQTEDENAAAFEAEGFLVGDFDLQKKMERKPKANE